MESNIQVNHFERCLHNFRCLCSVAIHSDFELINSLSFARVPIFIASDNLINSSSLSFAKRRVNVTFRVSIMILYEIAKNEKGFCLWKCLKNFGLVGQKCYRKSE